MMGYFYWYLQVAKKCTKVDCFTHTTGGKGNSRQGDMPYVHRHLGSSSEMSWREEVRMVEVRRPGTQSIYWGETSFNAYIRGQQHLRALQYPVRNQNNVFVCHREDFHRAEETEVKLRYKVVRPGPVGEGGYMLGPEAVFPGQAQWGRTATCWAWRQCSQARPSEEERLHAGPGGRK